MRRYERHGGKLLLFPKATAERQFTRTRQPKDGFDRHPREWPARAAQGDFEKGSRSPGADRPNLRAAWIREAAKGSACRAGQNKLNGVQGRSPGGGDWQGGRRRPPWPLPEGTNENNAANFLSAKRQTPSRQRPGAFPPLPSVTGTRGMAPPCAARVTRMTFRASRRTARFDGLMLPHGNTTCQHKIATWQHGAQKNITPVSRYL